METIEDSCFKTCPYRKNFIPALDSLQVRLERGEYLAKQDDLWHLFDKGGEGVTSGKDLKNILINLIWMDC